MNYTNASARGEVARSKPEAVVFDMDGLMFNTEDLYDEVTHELLGRRGHAFTREVKISIMGRPGPEALQILIDVYELDDSVEVLHSEIDAGFFRLLSTHLKMLPGLVELLEEVRSRKLPTAVATGSYRKFAEIALSHFGLLSGFSSVLTSEDVTRGKPDPEIYLKTAEALGVDAERMLVFEDSLLGSQAAASSGATTVAVPGEHCRDCDFSHTHLVVDSLEAAEIYELL